MVTVRWGILGVGRAGAARARALVADPRATPVLGWRGDPAAAGLAVADSVEAVLEADVAAVAICTPDTTHPALVRQALLAGKHVVCEFPLAGSADEAAALFDLADARGRVLHVEHIELLGPAARWIKAACADRRLTGGSCRFQSGARSEVFSVAHANVARLHRLLDAWGPPADLAVHERTDSWLVATLSWPGNPEHYAGEARIALEFRLEAGRRRRTELLFETDQGEITLLDRILMHRGRVVDLERGPGLFLTDQLQASAEILDGTPPTVGRDAVLAVLALADQLASAPLQDPIPPDRIDLSEFDLDAIEFEAG